MTIEEAKSIRIADYLYSLGYSPVKQQGINLWYKSPFREESEASFKVNTEREQWYDFGLGKGGNIISLAAHLYATDHVPYARYLSLLASKTLPSRASNIWRLFLYPPLPCLPTYKVEELT